MTELTRILKIEPAFDKRDPNPNKNYGVHGCEIRFVVKGPLGAVQFLLYTNWQLPHVTNEMMNKPIRDKIDLEVRFLPLPADLGYHSSKPIYDEQPMTRDKCEYLDGAPCYYDGSSLNAIGTFKTLLEKGSDGLWAELEDYYRSTFETKETHDEDKQPENKVPEVMP